jgi:hypothetical protein
MCKHVCCWFAIKLFTNIVLRQQKRPANCHVCLLIDGFSSCHYHKIFDDNILGTFLNHKLLTKSSPSLFLSSLLVILRSLHEAHEENALWAGRVCLSA